MNDAASIAIYGASGMLGDGLNGMESFGTLILAMDEQSVFTESTPGNNDVVSMTDRSIAGPSDRWDANGGLRRVSSNVNWNNYPTIARENAGEWLFRATGSDVTGSELTYVFGFWPLSLGGTCEPFDNVDGGTGSAIRIPINGEVRLESGSGAEPIVAPATTIVNLNAYIIAVTFSVASFAQAWVNGTQFAQVTTPSPTGNMTISRLWSSLNSSADWESPGLYMYQGVLSDANVEAAGQFLSDKWGLGQSW